MKSLRTAHRIKRRPQAFTLVEMLCAITIFCLVGYGAFNVLRSGLLLSSQNVGINVSALRCRVDYTYLKRAQSYEVLTYRSPD